MKAERKDGLNTKRRLIEAAEQLFLEKGFENVTLVDVSKGAGQKNRTAAQYHFGDRTGLITAVLDKHNELISDKRRAMLEAIEEQTAPTLLELVKASVTPIVEHIEHHPNGLIYLLLIRQLLNSNRALEYGWQGIVGSTESKRLYDLMREKMEPHTQEVLNYKMIITQCMLFNSLASFYDIRPTENSKVFADTLCNVMVAVLLDPTGT